MASFSYKCKHWVFLRLLNKIKFSRSRSLIAKAIAQFRREVFLKKMGFINQIFK